jgi:hypothetical protein
MTGLHRVRTAAVALAILAVPWASAAGQGTAERTFVSGGRIRLDLSAGDYVVKGRQDDRIVVTWTSSDPDDKGSASIASDSGKSEATVTTRGKHARFVIELPARSDVHADLSAGDIRIEGITGSKDIGSWAGDVDIDIGRPDDYAVVDVAVKAGDISALPFKVSKSGILQSFSWKGPGRHTLRVRLTAGDLRLFTTPAGR